ncbi:MAG TPA: methionine--tRNA ligase [Methylomirabilota bacterium]|jgi:methionyl-tRNA synthetase|nr:methionine--tRNA ligase [Methylomirabilota bacterium]
MSTFYLTTPIYYVNARPHLGHACTTIMADAMCRYRRLAGDRVYFLTGTDEHGERIAQVAAAAGQSPQAYADGIAAVFRETWRRLGITNDDFIRTTEPRHRKVVQAVLQRLHDAGEIYFGEYGGWYCYGCERFYTEKEIVDGKCPDHQTALTFVKEKNYFFKMSKYQGWLIKHLEDNPGFIQPDRYRNEVLGFLREPLQDLSISRPRSRLEWGIPLPFDDQYVTYVWFDALINYYSAVSDPANPKTRGLWEHVEHLIAKDILKPHGVYWPTMLKAAGIPLYRRLNVHGYWSLGGSKMSKSVGNVVEALQLTDKYGHDAFRYFLLREMNFGLDASFSEEAFVDRLNADLANDLGNLASRASTLIAAAGPVAAVSAPVEAADREIAAAAAEARAALEQAMQEFAFQKALGGIWTFIGAVNRYVDTSAPWALAKDPAKRPRLERVLCTLADSLGFLGIVLDPFLPDASGKIRAALGQSAPPTLEGAVVGRLASVPRVTKISGLFPRVDTKPAPTTPSPQGRGPGEGPSGETAGKIPITDFQKVELRVAEVLAAERVPKSKKLLKLSIRVGEETRTLVAGVAEHYEPGDLVGRKVVIVANLQPATLMGVESNGMVLAAEHGGTLSLLTLDRDLPSGAKVK